MVLCRDEYTKNNEVKDLPCSSYFFMSVPLLIRIKSNYNLKDRTKVCYDYRIDR